MEQPYYVIKIQNGGALENLKTKIDNIRIHFFEK